MKIIPFLRLTAAAVVMAIIALTVSTADAGKRNRCDRNGCRKSKHVTVCNKKPIKVAVDSNAPYLRCEVIDISNSKRGEARFQIPRGHRLTTQLVSARTVPQGNQVKGYRIHRLRLEAASRKRQTFGYSHSIEPYEYGDAVFSPLTLYARKNAQAFVVLDRRGDKNT